MYRIHGNNFKTISSLAFGIYKSNFMEKENISIIKGDLYNFIKEGYKGGYVDVFITYGKNLFIYDVNSLYPYIMKNCKLPVGEPIAKKKNIFFFLEI